MVRLGDWAIDADDRCYIVGKLKTRNTKEGGTEDYISNPRYYGSLSSAFSAILMAEKRAVVAKYDQDLGELIIRLDEVDYKFKELFSQAFKE